jgi:molecular chaperone DnaK (HSP70)
MGVSAKSQHLTNLKRTVFNFKHMLGRKFKDPIVQENIAALPYEVSEGPNGKIQIHIDYLGSKQTFSPEEVTAMLFTKLKLTAEDALKTVVNDVVISCPSYFTDCERRALIDAASIAGLNVLKLMNDTAATALAYGIFKQDLPLPEEKARNVIFVDSGHVGLQVAACSFNKGKMVMKACTHHRGIGGQAFDAALVKYFAEDFNTKTKLDAMKKPRAFLKLTSEVEKVKKQMSANTSLVPLNIECFMEERDLTHRVERAAFEEMIQEELSKAEKVMVDCLKASEWKQEDIYAVEIVGGSSRIPAIKAAIEKVFGKTSNTTLNSDESVSRGCALQCAILSPTFKVREFSVTDIQPFAIKLNWKAEQDNGNMVIFPQFHQIPFSKLLTFYRRSNFTVDAEYDTGKDAGDVPLQDPYIGNFEIGEVYPMPDGANQKVKVKVRINLNGVFGVNSANFVEKQEIEEEVPMEVEETKEDTNKKEKKDDNADNASNEKQNEKVNGEKVEDSEMKDAEKKEEGEDKEKEKKDTEEEKKSPPKMVKKKKTISKIIDLPITSQAVGAVPKTKLETSTAQESNFSQKDLQECDRLIAKNSVEEYIYDIRGKIHDELEEYLAEDTRGVFSNQLEDAENWLYEDGEDCERQVYVDKLKELKLVGEAAKKRKSEFEGRKSAIEAMGHSLQMAAKVVDAYKNKAEQYAHFNSDDVEKVAKLIEEKKTWMDQSCSTLDRTEKTTNPPILVCQFYQEQSAFEKICKPILNKPKPKIEPPPQPKEDKKESKENGNNQKDEKNEPATAENNGKMDVEGGSGDTTKAPNQQPTPDPKEMEVD